MKHLVRLFVWVALVAAMAIAGCGGRQTMASRSAAAYDEAKKNGIPIAAGEHGGHSNTAAQSAGIPKAETDHGAMAEMGHAAMPGMDHSTMPGMSHSKMPGMTPAQVPGKQREAMAGSQQGSAAPHGMAGMDHSAMSATPGMQHHEMSAPVTQSAEQAINTAIAQSQPSATLRADEFDTPAASSIGEAAKAVSGMTHSMDDTKSPRQEQHPPPPRHHGNEETS